MGCGAKSGHDNQLGVLGYKHAQYSGVALGKKLTLDLSAGYNLWVLDKKIQEVDDQEKVLAEENFTLPGST